MQVRLAGFLLLLPHLWAQYDALSSVPNGESVIFSTTLRQVGTSQPTWGKLFAVDSAGLRPFLIRPTSLVSGVYSPEGRWLAITRRDDCATNCSFVETAWTEVYDTSGQVVITVNGSNPVFSAGGKWMAVRSWPADSNPSALFVDLENRTRRTRTGSVGSKLQAVAVTDDGSAVLSSATDGLTLEQRDGTVLKLGPDAGNAVVSGDGQRIVFERAGNVWLRFADMDIDLGPGKLLGATADLLLALVLRADQLWTVSGYGGDALPLTSEPAGVRQATISPDGSAVYYVSGSGALVRWAEGATKPLLPPVVMPVIAPGPYAPGEVVNGQWTSPGGGAPSFRLGSTRIPPLTWTSESFSFQIPWEAAAPATAELVNETAIPNAVWETESRFPIWLAAVNARIRAAASEDFSSAITDANPARPGDILHLFATGLGPVIGGPVTGQTVNWAMPLRDPLQCTDGSTVLFAGIAPLTIGWYQVDLRLPDNAGAPSHTIRCSTFTYTVPVVAPPVIAPEP